LYRRIVRNPNYYEIAGKSGQHINDYLSELIEDTVAELAEVGCITVDENEMDL
jgi:pre-mRNA-splicing helicase BRR2